MNFIFEWQEQYVPATRIQNSSCSGHSVISSIYYIEILMTAFLTIFRNFSPLSEDFSKLFRKATRMFPNISENVRILPKTFEEDPKMFRSYTNEFKYNLRDKLDISEIIDIFTSEDMKFPDTYELYQWFIFQLNARVYMIKTHFLMDVIVVS